MNAITCDDLADLSSFHSYNNTKRKLVFNGQILKLSEFTRDPRTESHVLLMVSHMMA